MSHITAYLKKIERIDDCLQWHNIVAGLAIPNRCTSWDCHLARFLGTSGHKDYAAYAKNSMNLAYNKRKYNNYYFN